jgi:polyphosphate glucokinase
MHILGIDVGGSGIKGAVVDTETGKLLAERQRFKTPPGAEPQAVAEVAARLVEHFSWKGAVGIGFPAPIKHGIAKMAANVSPAWIGMDANVLFSQATGCPCVALNDADAAGMAEMAFGAGREQSGTVMMVTLGTGIGSAVFHDGRLLPNTEFGHIEIKGEDAEHRASDAARQREGMSWEKYTKRLNRYLKTMEKLIWPDLFILGGGISKQHKKFVPLLTVEARIVPAQFLNEAGIVGAALAARGI